MGNPTTYKNDTLTWTGGRRLKSYLKNDSSYVTTFEYNGDGLRTQKKIQNSPNTYETHKYYWADGKLLAETIHSGSSYPIRLKYNYSHAGLTGFTYVQQVSLKDEIRMHFTYIKNSFGDIVGICSSDGMLVCTYTYDAWGNCSAEDYSFSGIGQISALNPFRYRGYYFDSDLGLYYLQTRYYDPTTGRFISSDSMGPTLLQFA